MKRTLLVIKLAINGILTNKVRSILTTLGIIIGIAAVISLMTLGEGAQAEVNNQLSSLGSNLISVIPGTKFRGPPGTNTDVELTKRDYDFLKNNTRFPTINAVSPAITSYSNVEKLENEVYSEINGVNFNYPDIEELKLIAGKFFTENDVQANKNIAVIGPEVAYELFDKNKNDDLTTVLDKEINIKNLRFKIIGVLEARGSSSFNEQDKQIYIPYTTVGNKLFLTNKYNNIFLSVKDKDLIDTTVLQIEEDLSEFRGLKKEDKDFTVFTSEDILNTASQITGIFTGLLSSIAAISLIVGGIGISNIMLVSVTERTKEIGLRKAIGARESDILLQFLFESILLTLMGGILGIVFGILIAYIISSFSGIGVSLSLNIIILATSVSAIVGIIFGFFPAYKAAKLNPIDALRYE